MKVAQSAIVGVLVLVNDSNSSMNIGGRSVAPGESLSLAQQDAYPYLNPNNPEHALFLPLDPDAPLAKSASDEPDPLAELLKESVAKISEDLPALSDEELHKLQALEKSKGDAARVTLDAAITAELFKRTQGN